MVVKFPRFAFEKFPARTGGGTQMKSVGEAMGIGRTFSEAFLKAYGSRSSIPGLRLRGRRWMWGSSRGAPSVVPEQIDFAREELASGDLRRAKRAGWGDDTIGETLGLSGAEVEQLRHAQGLRPGFRRVDSCAGEVEAGSRLLLLDLG